MCSNSCYCSRKTDKKLTWIMMLLAFRRRHMISSLSHSFLGKERRRKDMKQKLLKVRRKNSLFFHPGPAWSGLVIQLANPPAHFGAKIEAAEGRP